MKNLKALSMIVVALLIGLAAAFYAAGWVARQSGAKQLVVAVVDIELGSKLRPDMLTSVDWPAASVPPGAFSDPALLQDRILKVGVLRGEPLLERKLAPLGTLGGLSAVIAEGKRAMTVRVNDVVGVAGFALPGNYVDVMVNAQQDRRPGEEGRQMSKTVLERVLVLAVAQESGRDDTKPKVVSAVTLELSPEDSERLDLARSVGTLSLVLRNQIDQRRVETAGVTKSALFKETGAVLAVAAVAHRPARRAPAPARAAAPAASCVELIQHGARSFSCF